MLKKWEVYHADRKKSVQLAKELGISEMLAGILLYRGIDTKKSGKNFLFPETEQMLYDPFLMKDMETAVNRICRAISLGEKITVYGDYDVDGITATALLFRNLCRLGANASFYIPNRQREGYGFHQEALHSLAAEGTQLLVSVDCGISSVEDVANVKDLLDIIITDHHIPGKTIPDAVAVVNPHQVDCSYPNKNLAGVGVAYKLCQALWKKMKQEDFLGDLEFVALGTIADVVSLLGENRKLVKLGLERMVHTEFKGIQALIEVSGLAGKNITSTQVGFILAPRLNAAGRIGDAVDGVKLLLADISEEAEELAQRLHEENLYRQEIEREILDLAEEKLSQESGFNRHSIVLDGEGWHPGVIGIVASRLVEKYYLPTIIISRNGNICKGSCRSIKGIHIYEALQACKEHLLGFGGHEQAAGITLQADHVDSFRIAFDSYVANHLSDEDSIPHIPIEFEMLPQDVTMDLVEELARLEPYGMGNPKPVFGCRNVRGENARPIGRNGQHLSFLLNGTDSAVKMICWNKGDYAGIVNAESVDIVYVPEMNEWQGRRSVECFLQEMEPADCERVFPNRDMLIKIYTFLRGLEKANKKIPYDSILLTKQYVSFYGHISLYTMEQGLQVFQELGILCKDLQDKEYIMKVPKAKLDLQQSLLYRSHLAAK